MYNSRVVHREDGVPMIIIDFSGIAISSIVINKTLDENLIRHMILNSIRMYRSKFHKEYGEIVIAADGANNWRRGAFPQYKKRYGITKRYYQDIGTTSYEIASPINEDLFPLLSKHFLFLSKFIELTVNSSKHSHSNLFR